ncbi:MAG: RCC1 domain-containing protein [Myxococcota bacterium]
MVLLLTTLALAAPPPPSSLHATDVALGEDHGCLLTADDTVRCWGDNRFGQLGGTVDDNGWSEVPGLRGVRALRAGAQHTCALHEDGTVSCWGDADLGKLGGPGPGPVRVPGLSNVQKLALGVSSTCALLNSGAVSCWGDNLFGQLGSIAPRQSPLPLPVPGIAGATDIAVGEAHACAITPDGLICWGRNDDGQLGLPVFGEQIPPSRVGAVHQPTAVSARQNGTCTSHEDGVRCWGRAPGRLTPDALPQSVLTVGQPAQLSVGYGHGCAMVGTRIACWGEDRDALGGLRVHHQSVVGAFGVNDAQRVDTSDGLSCAVRSAGPLACWGNYTDQERAAVMPRREPDLPPDVREKKRKWPPTVTLEVRVHEVLAPERPRVRIELRSVSEMPCANAAFALDTTIKRRRTTLVLGEPVLPSGPCIAQPGPAVTTYDLPSDASGRQEVVVQQGRTMDVYQVMLTDRKLEVLALQQTFSQLTSEPVQRRVPDGTLAMSCDERRDLPVCVRRATLGFPTCDDIQNHPDWTRHPRVDRRAIAAQPWLAADPEATLISPDFDREQLKQLVEEQWMDGSGCVDITVRTWEGRMWRNTAVR